MSRKIVLESPKEVSEKDLREKEILMKAKEVAVMELLHKGQGRPGTVDVLHGKWIKKRKLTDKATLNPLSSEFGIIG